MKVYKNGREPKGIKNAVLTLGNFDGLHLGHRKIIRKVSERGRLLNLPSVVYTFEPHPLKVVAPHKSPPLIIDAETKAGLMEALGIDNLIFAKFTREFAAKHPDEFVREVLLDMLSVKEVWVGHDFSFGKGGEGTVKYLKELADAHGFKVYVIPAYKKGGHIVSSSRIRSLIQHGRVGEASRLLGGRYLIKGRVVKGRGIGKTIGFPTANIKPRSELIPKNGVYAGYVSLEGRELPCALNIGTAPTFGAREKTIEAHILDFRGNIYGKNLRVSFVRRLRGERAFKSKEELIRQIRKDVERAGNML